MLLDTRSELLLDMFTKKTMNYLTKYTHVKIIKK